MTITLKALKIQIFTAIPLTRVFLSLMSSLFLFSSANPESCNVAINEEHVPLAREEMRAGKSFVCISAQSNDVCRAPPLPGPGDLGSFSVAYSALGKPLLKNLCTLGFSTESLYVCTEAQSTCGSTK